MNKSIRALSVFLCFSLLLMSCENKSLDSTESPHLTEAEDLFGTLLAMNPSQGFRDGELRKRAETEGWTQIRNSETDYAKFMEELKRGTPSSVKMLKELGFSTDREIVAAFVWNVIENQKGSYEWDIPDTIVSALGEADVSLSAVVIPFVNWDQDSIPGNCKAFDFLYYDYKADTPTDWEAYSKFLMAAVERYDGDGVEDMPGLTLPVKAWEIGNEFDGNCGGDLNQAENYFQLQKISYESIKTADPEAMVLNGGSLELKSTVRDIPAFWEEFFELGGGNFIDAFNMHFNRGKSGVSDKMNEEFEDTVSFFNETMQKNGIQKPIWITEFGTYSGSPTLGGPVQQREGQTPNLPSQSEELQAAWHMKESIFAFAHNVTKILIDFQGADNSSIGGAGLYKQNGEPRAFAETLKTINQKLKGFDSVEEIEAGQYRFTLEGKEIYVLWEGSIPKELNGPVQVTDMYGQTQEMDASEIQILADAPIFVEKE